MNSGAAGTLDGSGSDDGDTGDAYTDALTYKWTLVSGTLSSWTDDTSYTDNATRDFTAPTMSTGDSAQTLIFQLDVQEAAVRGGSQLSSSDNITITIQPGLPVVTAANVTLSGASGAGNSFIIGDNVTASWDSGASGDNQSDITAVSINFSEFGGDNVSATYNAGAGTWSAIYEVQAGSINNQQNRNVTIYVTDNDGNITNFTDSDNATVDNVRPTTNISGNSTTDGVSPFSLAVTFGESVTGFDNASDVTISNGSVFDNISGSGANYTIWIQPSGGNVGVSIDANVAQDAAGNGNAATASSYNVSDNAAPTLTVTDNVSGLTNQSSFTAYFTFSEDVSGFAAGDISLSSGTAGSLTQIAADNYSMVITNVSSDVTITVAADAASDNASNTGPASSQTHSVSYDGAAPTLTITDNVSGLTNQSSFCLLYTSPSPRDLSTSRMPSSA